jgi:hypothetical protein
MVNSMEDTQAKAPLPAEHIPPYYKPKIIIILSIFIFTIVLSVLIRAHVIGASFKTLTLGYVAFIAGTAWELWRLSKNWLDFYLIVLAAFGLNLFGLLDTLLGRPLQDFIRTWPFGFSFCLVFIGAGVYVKKILPKLGEGATLMHSFALSYWLLEMHRSGRLGIIWLILSFIPLTYCLLHAFTSIEISKKDRLCLSLWSTLVMIVFGINYFRNIISLRSVESLLQVNSHLAAFNHFAETFLLGASGIYIVLNLGMIGMYLPGKRTFFNDEYFALIKKLTAMHIERYSPEQVNQKHVLFISFMTVGFLLANWITKMINPNFAVWIILILLPILSDYIFKWWDGKIESSKV